MAQKTRYFVVTDNDVHICILKAYNIEPYIDVFFLNLALKEFYNIDEIHTTVEYSNSSFIKVKFLIGNEYIFVLFREIFLYS